MLFVSLALKAAVLCCLHQLLTHHSQQHSDGSPVLWVDIARNGCDSNSNEIQSSNKTFIHKMASRKESETLSGRKEEELAKEEKRHEDRGPMERVKEGLSHAIDRLTGIGESPEQKENRKRAQHKLK